MDKSEVFRILNIDEKSNPEDIKKAFRKIIFAYHPDTSFETNTDSLNAAQIIEAYKKALQIAERNRDEFIIKVKNKFKDMLRRDFIEINSSDDFYNYFLLFFENMTLLLYRKEHTILFNELSSLMFNKIEYLKNNIDFNIYEEINYIIYAFNMLIQSRLTLLNNISPDEYKMELLRRDLINYLNTILTKKDYLSFRFEINHNLETMLNDILKCVKNIKDENCRKELNCFLFLVELFSEESFSDKIWNILRSTLSQPSEF